jgi:tetratricopeptide (TPR) repeat protein
MTTRRKFAVLAAGVWLALPGFAAKRDTWVEVRSPNFIVVSNAGEKQARKTAAQFEQIRTLFRSSLAAAGGHATPVITIFAMKDDKFLSELMPEFWVKGHVHPAGWFAYRMGQFYIALNLEAGGTNPYETVYHEYYHSLTMPYFPNMPVWLAEGLADFFGNSEINGNNATMGRADPGLINELRTHKLIPLDVLFKVDHSSPYYNEQNKTSLFYAESWALTHYLFIGDNQVHRPALLAYADALSHGKSSEEAATLAFGDLNKLQSALANYVGKFSFYYFQTKAPAELPASDFASRTLSDADMEAYRGGFFAIRGSLPDAIRMLQEAVQLDPKLALGYQNLAMAELFNGQREPALESVTKAIELDPKNGFTHYLRAYLSVNGGGNMPNDSQIEADLRQSVSLSPDLAAPYGLLSWYFAARGENLPEALTLAQKANALEPGNISYELDIAQVLVRMRRYNDAQALAVRARESATPAELQQVAQFIAYMQQARQLDRENAAVATDVAKEGGGARAQAVQAVPDADDEADSSTATGTVSQVSCVGGLKLQLETAEGTRTFRTQPGTPFRITAPTRAQANVNPCTSLKGLTVSVQFTPDDTKEMTGTMHKLQILPPGGSPIASPAGAPHKLAPLKGPPTVATTSEGTVKAAQCSGRELKITLTVRNVDFNLHARDWTRVEIREDVAFQNGEFDPCKQLQGKDAKVKYVLVEKKSYDGEIQAIEVEK